MDKPDSSPLETLRQLKEMLDAGVITPQEFNSLKQKLLFPDAPTPPAASPAPAPLPPAPIMEAPTAPVAVPPPAPVEPAPRRVEEHPVADITPVIPPPVDDPLLPPVVAAPGATPLEPVVLDPHTQRPTEGPVDVQDYYHDGPADEPRKSPLGPILIIGGVIVLLAIIGYLVLGSRSSERLTSNSITAADTTAVQIEEGPQAEQLDLPPAAVPETVRVQPNIPVTATPVDSAGAGAPVVDAAAAEAAARAQVQRVLTAFYNDLQTPPFSAAQYFAPQVERFLQLQNTTPAAIDENLSSTYFPEFAESKYSISPGTLQISPPAEDGSVTVTFQERGRSLRKSLNQYQQTLTQVRARFDNTGKLTFFRQERLLENKFTDAKPAATPAPAPETAPTQE
ncbi:SHOCT domain-containing protein [Hymenobacter gummosus]|uniref:SHOCT domain-containing protein n=1 Tax=Hymenobacter gummosus TaxID=1776032 RepID=A0A3S0J9Q6_9BACT|nr:SHOCT domain-containing protein [Hymenobacter gummosus]RTQ49272.1 SHOCT domain-containing protein [Hymenobacter gummosus]